MTVLGLTADGKKIVLTTSSGPSSYSTGGFSVTIDEVNYIHGIIEARMTGGYVVEVSYSGNTVTVIVYSSPGSEVTTGTDLSTETVTIVVVGS